MRCEMGKSFTSRCGGEGLTARRDSDVRRAGGCHWIRDASTVPHPRLEMEAAEGVEVAVREENEEGRVHDIETAGAT